jgi:hypothetical protein
VALKGVFKSIQKKKFPWATKSPRGRISNSVSLKGTMNDLIFHVYEGKEVKAHSLTVDQLEDLIISKKVNIGEDEIVPLELSKDTEGSY